MADRACFLGPVRPFLHAHLRYGPYFRTEQPFSPYVRKSGRPRRERRKGGPTDANEKVNG
jgi:hypothetical protein